MSQKPSVNQDCKPNFREEGKLYLVRCFSCGGEYGKENYMPAVATGRCAWCGWEEQHDRKGEANG